MKKILICLLMLSFFMDAQQSVNAMHSRHQQEVPKEQAYNNGKPLEYEIDLSDYQGDKCSLPSEFTSHIAAPITAKAKKIGNKIMPSLPYVIPAAVFFGYQYYTSDPEIGFSLIDAAATGLQALSGNFLVATIFGDQIKRGMSTFKQKYLPIDWQTDDYKKILTYKKIIDERFEKKLISEKIKDKFNGQLALYKLYAVNGDEGMDTPKECIKKMESISLLPVEIKQWDWQVVRPKLEELIKAYPSDTRIAIKKLVRECVTSSKFTRPPKNIFCFYGPPGTGKTRLAEEIAKILDLSIEFFRPSLTGAEKMIAPYIEKDGKEVMLDLFTKETNNYKNNILFIDEFDRSLNDSKKHKEAFFDFFMHVTSKSDATYQSGRIQGLDIDMSSAIIIMACNNLPVEAEGNKGALRSRLKTSIITVDKIEKDKQREIAFDTFIKEIENAKFSDHFLIESELKDKKIDDKHKFILEEIIDKNLISDNYELKEDELLEKKQNPGVRELTDVVKKYVMYLVGRLTCPDEELDQYEFDVDAAYEASEIEKDVEIKKKIEEEKDINEIIL
ncbi:MAG: ATP-binding protein [Alphaproteobacteria bacterium]|nr:ATP-binding protein [Alphaproteobacteria bacterium]